MDESMARVLAREKIKELERFEGLLPEQIVGQPLVDLRDSNWGESVDNVKRDELLRIVRGGNKAPRFFIFSGPAGIGKSSLATSLARRLFLSGPHQSMGYTTGPELMHSLSFDNNNGNPTSKLIKPDILLMDDIGVTDMNLTPIRQEGLWSIINSRWGKPNSVTFITTNLSLSDLQETFNKTAWDRIKTDSFIAIMKGQSKRRRKRW